MLKKIVIAVLPLGMLALLATCSVPVFAQTASKSADKAARLTQRETALKARADKEIDRRIDKLHALVARINAFKKLSAENKASFTSQIQTEIANLTTLKAKIDADADADTLRADVKSIVASYRIYALFIPKIHLLAAADRMNELADKLSALATKLQSRINDAKTNGNDVATLQAALTDMQAKIADAKTQYQNVISTVTPLTPDSYPGNQSTLQVARKMIQAGHQDLVAARKDAETIIQGLRSLKKSSTKPATPSATP